MMKSGNYPGSHLALLRTSRAGAYHKPSENPEGLQAEYDGLELRNGK